MKTETTHDAGSNALASWWRSPVDSRFFFVVIFDLFFGERADSRAVVDDFGNLVSVWGFTPHGGH